MSELSGQIAVVTGAARGIGKGIALRFGLEGAAVVCADVNEKSVTETAGEITKAGGKGWPYPIDLVDVSAIRHMVKFIEERMGPVGVLVNCAGICQTKPLLEISQDDWDRLLDVNLRGLFFCMQEAAKHMVGRGRGRIINIASVAGRGARDLQAHYAASKAGVISVTRSAALAFGPNGVTVNAICPGVIPTPMWDEINQDRVRYAEDDDSEGRLHPFERVVAKVPLRRAGAVEEVAGVAVFLASNQASYVNGQAINVCGGLEMD